MNSFDGTEKEFEELINKHKASVYGTVYAYFKYNSEIDDIVQETFINAYFKYGTINVNHGVHYERIADSEQSVRFAKLSGNERLTAKCVLSLAFDYQEVNRKVMAFSEAYELADSIGYHEVCTECAYWLGTLDIRREKYDSAKQHFQSALDHYTHVNPHTRLNICVGDSIRTHALATAALNSMEMLADENMLNGNYLSLNSFCQLLYVNEKEIISHNNYGWDIPGRQSRPRFSRCNFGRFEGQNIITSWELYKNGTLDYEYYTYDGVLVKQHYTVVSRNKSVIVPAGEFRDCLHIHRTEEIPGFNKNSAEHLETYKHLTVCDFWFAECVGEVKAFVVYPNRHKELLPSYYLELAAYSIIPSNEPAQKYFPLVIGNKWEYAYFDENQKSYSDAYQYCDYYEVNAISDGIAYISNSGYSFMKGKDTKASLRL